MNDSQSHKDKSGFKSQFLCVIFIIILVSFIIYSAIGCKDQNPTNEQESLSKSSITLDILKKEYELRERCGLICIDYFLKLHRDKNTNDNYTTHNDYVSHYNKNLNKCYMLVKSKSVPKKNVGSIVSSEYIIDVHENNTFGIFTTSSKDIFTDATKNKSLKEATLSDKEDAIIECRVYEKKCKSKDEWGKLIKPFMDE